MLSTIWQIIKLFWPLWAILAAMVLIKFMVNYLTPKLLYRWRTRKRFTASHRWLSDRELTWMLRGMNPSEFEEYIADLFSKLGYKTEVRGGPFDKGVDVMAEKDGIKHYIQCKKFKAQEVGVGDVRAFYGAIADHLANGKGYFITTNKFTLEAEKFVEDKPIELVDGFKLVNYIRLSEKKRK